VVAFFCALLIVPNVKVRMEAQHFFPSLSLHDLFWEIFTFTLLSDVKPYKKHTYLRLEFYYKFMNSCLECKLNNKAMKLVQLNKNKG
jgi:hypothetical protein